MPVKYRISWSSGGFILAATGISDFIIQPFLILTVVGAIVSAAIGVVMTFVLWLTFKLHGVNYSGPAGLKKSIALLGSGALEAVPGIDVLPLTTIGAVMIILESRKEDRETARKKVEEQAAAQKQQAAANEHMMYAQRVANDNAIMRAANDNAQEEATLSQAA